MSSSGRSAVGSQSRASVAVKALWVLCLSALFLGTSGEPAYADDLQLNFAAVNQSPWTPGAATVYDNKFLLPDPPLSGHLDLGDFNVDPGSAALNALGNLIGINLKGLASLTMSPSGDFTAGLSASYHIDAGTVNLNYPEKVQLNLPTQVQSGQTFQVSASLPGPLNKLQITPAQLSALGGTGYTGLNNILNFSNAIYTPDRGFQTTFPYADAQLNIALKASAGVHAEDRRHEVSGSVLELQVNVDPQLDIAGAPQRPVRNRDFEAAHQ